MAKKINYYIYFISPDANKFTTKNISDIIKDIKNNPRLYCLDLTKPLYIYLVDFNDNILYYDILILNYVSAHLGCWDFYLKLSVYIEKYIKNRNLIIFISDSYTSELNMKTLVDDLKESKYELEKEDRDISWFFDKWFFDESIYDWWFDDNEDE